MRQFTCNVQCGLTAHASKERTWLFDFQDASNGVGNQRLNVDFVSHFRIVLDGSGV